MPYCPEESFSLNKVLHPLIKVSLYDPICAGTLFVISAGLKCIIFLLQTVILGYESMPPCPVYDSCVVLLSRRDCQPENNDMKTYHQL